MFISASDAAYQPNEKPWKYCIVGSGPAGALLALELERHGEREILILESGLKSRSIPHASLSTAIIRDPSRHEPMESAVARCLGGTSTIWGGRCVQYDPIDFEERSHVTEHHWPISDTDIRPFYGRACNFLECGLPNFDMQSACPAAALPVVPGFAAGEVRDDTLELWSLPLNIGRHYHDRLSHSQNISIALDATCLEIIAAQGKVKCLKIASLDGFTGTVSANQYILCAGGLESTRLLMCSPSIYADRRKPPQSLGHYYQGHISGRIADVEFSTPPDETNYDFNRTAMGVYVRRRFTIADDTQRANKTLNFAAWLDHPPIANAEHQSALLSAAYLSLTFPLLGRLLAPPAIRAAVTTSSSPISKSHHLKNILRNPIATLIFAIGFAYSRFVPRRRIPGFLIKSSSNRYALHYHAEQAPNFDSQVSLSDAYDDLEMPRLAIDLRYSQQDVDSVITCHKLIDDYLQKLKIGKLIYHSENLEHSVLCQARDGFHQIGTTRMSLTAADGVVDSNLKLFGTDNLFVCSSSVFPTSSQANPTLLITALAARLAEHLVVARDN